MPSIAFAPLRFCTRFRRRASAPGPGVRLWLVLAVVLLAALGLAGRAVLRGRDATWAHIQATGVWRVAMDPSFPPFENLDAAGAPAGFDVDLVNAIAARWGVRAQIVGVGFDELLDAVTARRVDAAVSALPVVEHRTREVAFSVPYFDAGELLIVPVESPIRSAADLAGRRVAAEWGSAGDAQARALQRAAAGDLQLVLRESSDAALEALLAGEADAAVCDAVSLALFAPGRGKLVAVGEPLESAPYVAVVPVDAPKLRQALDDAIIALRADGTLATIEARWLGR